MIRLAIIGLIAALVLTVAAARLAFELTSARDTSAEEPWAYDRMEFVAWNGHKWAAWVRDNEFELVPDDAGNWSRHSNGTLAFIDWNGEPWQAKIDADTFLLAHRGDWEGEPERDHAIRYRDWSGRDRLRTVAQLTR